MMTNSFNTLLFLSFIFQVIDKKAPAWEGRGFILFLLEFVFEPCFAFFSKNLFSARQLF